MEHNSRMKEITGNLKQDVKDLLGESASLFTGFFKRGACTVRAVADKWKAFPLFTPAACGLKSPLKLREDNRRTLCITSTQARNGSKPWKF